MAYILMLVSLTLVFKMFERPVLLVYIARSRAMMKRAPANFVFAGVLLPGAVLQSTIAYFLKNRTPGYIWAGGRSGVNLHFSKLGNKKTKCVWFSYKNTTGYQKTMF